MSNKSTAKSHFAYFVVRVASHIRDGSPLFAITLINLFLRLFNTTYFAKLPLRDRNLLDHDSSYASRCKLDKQNALVKSIVFLFVIDYIR